MSHPVLLELLLNRQIPFVNTGNFTHSPAAEVSEIFSCTRASYRPFGVIGVEDGESCRETQIAGIRNCCAAEGPGDSRQSGRIQSQVVEDVPFGSVKNASAAADHSRRPHSP